VLSNVVQKSVHSNKLKTKVFHKKYATANATEKMAQPAGWNNGHLFGNKDKVKFPYVGNWNETAARAFSH